MLYKFKSKAAADLIMLEPNGRRLLQIIGKHPEDRRGILLPEQMGPALAALQAAIEQEEAEQKTAIAEAVARGETPPSFEGISLRQRAVPFMDMLRRCQQADKEIVWGV